MTRSEELVERCIAARVAYHKSGESEGPELAALVDARLALDSYIKDECRRRQMAERSARVARSERIPGDLASCLLRDASK